MPEKKNDPETGAEPREESGADPMAAMNRLMAENPGLRSTFETVMRVLEAEADPGDENGEVLAECVEIDGVDYIVTKHLEIDGTTYLYLSNENDVLDFLIQKVVVEDGEEYVVGLDSEREFDLVQACLQRDFLLQLQEKYPLPGGEETDKP